MLHAFPKRVQSLPSSLDWVTRDQRAIDRADRRAYHPIRLNSRLMQRLVDADLVSAERTAALEYEHHPPVFFLQRQCRNGAFGRILATSNSLSAYL